MEVFWEETEDVFCAGQAAVHHVPGELVQSRHQLSGGERRGWVEKHHIQYRTGLLSQETKVMLRDSH